MWQLLIEPVVGLVKDHFKNKAEEKQAVHKAKMTRIEQDGTWEVTQADASKHSLKDEWFTVILSIPLIGAFIPDLVPTIEQGFIVLNGMPEYYKAFLAAAVAASFGIRTLANVWGKKQ